jgi:aerobic-type carbon monoxide dehydrogenase small subunit (CoxS/CutS family)
MEAEIRLRVNGSEHRLTIDTPTTLLHALRERLGITSVGAAAAIANAVHHTTGRGQWCGCR